MIKKKPIPGKGKVRVTFVLPADHPYQSVSVVGEFNGWDPTANRFVKRSNQTYSTAVTLDANSRYAFRYYAEEGVWINDKDADGYEPSGYGSENCIVTT